MARTRKSTQLLNLIKYDVLIEDRSVNSEYFKISQFDGYFYGGRNSFLIAGASVLAPNSKILVEVLNKDGQTVYSAPVQSFIEGNSRLIQVEIYDDTPIGPGKIVILGSANSYIDGTPVPDSWKGKYNVRWIADVVISPLIENKTPIRFSGTPNALVTERIYASTSESAYLQRLEVPSDLTISPKYFNVFSNGYLLKFNNDSSTKFLTKYLGATVSGSVSFISDGVPISASVSLPITRIFNSTLAESDGSRITTSDGKILLEGFISASGTYITELKPFGAVTASSNLNIVYDELIAGTTGSNISFANIRVSNVSTISGEVRSVEVSVKSEADPGEYTSLGKVEVNVTELLKTDINAAPVWIGDFNNNFSIPSYWYASTMSLSRNESPVELPSQYNSSVSSSTLTINRGDFALIDSITTYPNIVGNSFENNVAYFIGTTDETAVTLFPQTEYTIALDAVVSKYSSSIELDQNDYSLQIYLVPLSGSSRILTTDARGQLIGTLTPEQPFVKKNFDKVEFNFTPKTQVEGRFGLRFVGYGGFWYIGDISLKPAEEPYFSPDEIDILIPILDYDNTVLSFQLHYLDINNNSAGIHTTTTPKYFQGTRKFVKRVGDDMTGELYIKGLPIQQQALQDAFTGLINGGIINANAPDSWSYNISSGSGYIIDNYTNPLQPEYRLVSWSQINKVPNAFQSTGSVAIYPRTNIAIDINGNVHEQSSAFTPEDYRNYIVLGRVAHVGTPYIQRALSLPLTTYNRGFHWFDLANAIGIINVAGNVYYASGSGMSIAKTSGETYRVGSNYRNDITFPDITTDPASTKVSFAYRYRSGSTFAEHPVTTIVSGNLYDNGTGTLATVNPNKFTVQRIYYFGATNTTRIQFGQNVYNTMEEAETAAETEQVVVDPNLQNDASLRAYLIVGSSATDLSNLTQAEFVTVGKFSAGGGGSSGGGGATALSELTDVNLTGLSVNDILAYNGTVWNNVSSITSSLFGTSSWAQGINGGTYITGSASLAEVSIVQNAQYLVLSSSGDLINERVLIPSSRFSASDGGANGNYNLDLSQNMRTSVVGLVIDGGGSAITVGEKSEIMIPFSASIQSWTLLADMSGSITLDIWKSSYTNYPPNSSNSIVSTNKPFISSNIKNRSTTLTGWDTNVNTNDTLKFYVSSSSTIQRVNLTLELLRL